MTADDSSRGDVTGIDLDACICGTPALDYEGPQEDCEVHGQRRRVLVEERARLRDDLAAAQQEVERIDRDRGTWRKSWHRVRDERDAARAQVASIEALLVNGGSRHHGEPRMFTEAEVRAALRATS